jgi:hypothetical protein
MFLPNFYIKVGDASRHMFMLCIWFQKVNVWTEPETASWIILLLLPKSLLGALIDMAAWKYGFLGIFVQIFLFMMQLHAVFPSHKP